MGLTTNAAFISIGLGICAMVASRHVFTFLLGIVGVLLVVIGLAVLVELDSEDEITRRKW